MLVNRECIFVLTIILCVYSIADETAKNVNKVASAEPDSTIATKEQIAVEDQTTENVFGVTTEASTTTTEKVTINSVVTGSTNPFTVPESNSNYVINNKDHNTVMTIAPVGEVQKQKLSGADTNRNDGVSIFMTFVFVLMAAVLFVFAMWSFYNLRQLWWQRQKVRQDWEVNYRLIDSEMTRME
ncbi:uncharacterized protein LOC116413039 isoform X1 [Galleria mellonella]|uniref:Uncharacterized protein LOC116413039 isoform X1 n=1 Tax=Galleria mellonella TaxID=7137 RepID=A0ABM3MPN7_GALME|nr:uncharacterized protein LOC116413039 isoform X1 [Galleria mellonella]